MKSEIQGLPVGVETALVFAGADGVTTMPVSRSEVVVSSVVDAYDRQLKAYY